MMEHGPIIDDLPMTQKIWRFPRGYPNWILLYFMKDHPKIDDLGVLSGHFHSFVTKGDVPPSTAWSGDKAGLKELYHGDFPPWCLKMHFGSGKRIHGKFNGDTP